MVLLLWSNFKNSRTSQLKALWVVNPSTEPTTTRHYHPFPLRSTVAVNRNTPVCIANLKVPETSISDPKAAWFKTAFSDLGKNWVQPRLKQQLLKGTISSVPRLTAGAWIRSTGTCTGTTKGPGGRILVVGGLEIRGNSSSQGGNLQIIWQRKSIGKL